MSPREIMINDRVNDIMTDIKKAVREKIPFYINTQVNDENVEENANAAGDAWSKADNNLKKALLDYVSAVEQWFDAKHEDAVSQEEIFDLNNEEMKKE